MKKLQHESSPLTLPDGTAITASLPVIVSASRATDIPAFFPDWLMNRLRAGYCAWINPFNAQQKVYVAFRRTRAIVFWSKNPRPLMEHLDEIDRMGIGYYFQFSLNDYESEGIEPGVPALSHRIETFRRLADRIGSNRVIWRFDPLLLSDHITVDELLSRLFRLADQLRGATEKLVFSFADISAYRKVKANLGRSGGGYREFTEEEKLRFAEGLAPLKKEAGLRLATCAETIDLSCYGVEHNKCIDDELLAGLYPEDQSLMQFLGQGQEDMFSGGATVGLKDIGQREECGCILSKDIGAYNTCPHLCSYCYANSSRKLVLSNFERRSTESEVPVGLAGKSEQTEQSYVMFHQARKPPFARAAELPEKNESPKVTSLERHPP
jgi:hypothetical protein